jgi:integrase
MPQKLTDPLVANAKPPAMGRLMLWDALLPGFGLRITDKGSKSWVVMYRVGGRDAVRRRLTLGKYPALSLAKAREQARAAFQDVARGTPPASATKEEEKSTTFTAVAEEFVERHAKQRNRSWRETERILRRYVTPEWGPRQIAEITRKDVIKLLDGLVDRGAPVMAKQTHSTIRKLFNWAVDRGVLDASPCVRLSPPAKAKDRDRVLSDKELADVWRATEQLGWPFGPVIKLLILTGQRRQEVASMRWPDIDLDRALWTLPRELTKTDRVHEVPFSSAALAVLRAAPKVHTELVFTTNGRTPVANFSMSKLRLDNAVMAERARQGVPPVPSYHLHDLRRTLASGMARRGVAPHVIEKILNHQSGVISGVAAVYNRHAYQDEKRHALEDWATFVLKLVAQPNGGSSRAKLETSG